MATDKQRHGTSADEVEIDTIPDPRAGYIEGDTDAEAMQPQAAARAGATTFPAGIDVSGHQGIINWTGVAQAEIAFAFAKASEGTSFVDPQFANNWARMKQANILRGAYHFFRPSLDPVQQANHFISQVEQLNPGDLQPMIDIEVTDGVGPAHLVDGVQQWIDRVKSVLNRDPIIYTGPSFWQTATSNSTQFSKKYPLWIAHYTNAPQPKVPGGWPVWTFWQFTDAGSVQGVSGKVDRDRFN